MKTSDEAAGASHKLVPIPPPPYGRTLEVNGAYSPESNPTGDYPASKMFDLNKYPATAKSAPPDGPAAILRLTDAESDVSKKAARDKNEMPEVRYRTADDVWWEFWGGLGKGIAQNLSDIAIYSAKAHRASRGNFYIDFENPDWFGSPVGPWDNTGRQIAPGVLATLKGVPSKPKTWNGKIIGKVTPPKHLKPGTAPFGDDMHEKVVDFLKKSYPHTKFRISIKRGQRGVDMGYESGLKPSPYIEIKPNNRHSEKYLTYQIQNWGYDKSDVRVFTYDELGNIYDGFGK